MVPGFKVGHHTNLEHVTGCTVVLAPSDGAVGGVDVRGFAPGTIGTETLKPGRAISHVHAVVLSGGSAYGLATASGVMRYLEERNIGFRVGAARVPIVAGAILFDLTIGSPDTRPDADDGYAACLAAGVQVAEGSVGAGTGATVGKFNGVENSTKGGIGYAERQLASDITLGAIVAVNSLGDVIDHATGAIIGGARLAEGGWLDSSSYILGLSETHASTGKRPSEDAPRNTTIGVVLTDAELTVEQANMVAVMAHDGIARATRPSHTFMDGDTLFVLASGTKGPGDLNVLGHAAAVCVADAIVRGVKHATTLGGIRSHNE